MDALLRFRSAALEAQFWASGPVRAALLGADRVALFICICNNALSAYAMAAVGAAAELRMHYKWAALFVGAQLLSTWCAALRSCDASGSGGDERRGAHLPVPSLSPLRKVPILVPATLVLAP